MSKGGNSEEVVDYEDAYLDEERIKKDEAKATKQFLGEEIESEKLDKDCEKTDAALDVLEQRTEALQQSLWNFQKAIQNYVKSNNEQYARFFPVYSEKVQEGLNNLFAFFEAARKFFDNDLVIVIKYQKDIHEEIKCGRDILRTEKKEGRVLRRAERRDEPLHEKEKLAALQKQHDIVKQLNQINEELAEFLEHIAKLLREDINRVGEIVGERKKINKSLKKAEGDWKALRKLLPDLTSFVGMKSGLSPYFKERNRQVHIFNKKAAALLETKEPLYQELGVLDKEMDAMEVEEAVAIKEERK